MFFEYQLYNKYFAVKDFLAGLKSVLNGFYGKVKLHSNSIVFCSIFYPFRQTKDKKMPDV